METFSSPEPSEVRHSTRGLPAARPSLGRKREGKLWVGPGPHKQPWRGVSLWDSAPEE